MRTLACLRMRGEEEVKGRDGGGGRARGRRKDSVEEEEEGRGGRGGRTQWKNKKGPIEGEEGKYHERKIVI